MMTAASAPLFRNPIDHALHLLSVDGQEIKQRAKNGLYRLSGELVSLGRKPILDFGLRVLMYHKVSSAPGNTVSVPPELFASHMSFLSEAGYNVVSLDDVVAAASRGTLLPARAVLLTFDDGYRDNLIHAAPVLLRHGYPAVVFVPVDCIGSDRPLPHDEHLVARGVSNPVLDWDEIFELERSGVRVESHGLRHRPLSSLDLEAAREEVVRSKALLEERLGRSVDAFAFVKGSRAHFRSEHVDLVRAAGYAVAFSTVTGSNPTLGDPFRLRRYNVEPYPVETLRLVLEGRCDVLALKDSVAGAYAKRALNAMLRTSS
jgi:peptidoglycan/xylan/chitin deacetylase (PgdA/CDA1 family)